MNWTYIYFKNENSNVFILVWNHLDNRLKQKGATLKNSSEIYKLVEWADIVVIASGDVELSDYVSKIASDKLINRADYPEKGNVIVPNRFYVCDVEISIFTGSKSPLISKYF